MGGGAHTCPALNVYTPDYQERPRHGAGARERCLVMCGYDTTCVTKLLHGREGPRQVASGVKRGLLSCPAMGVALLGVPGGPGTGVCFGKPPTPQTLTTDPEMRKEDLQGSHIGPRTPSFKAGARSGAFGATKRLLFPPNFFLLSGESRGWLGGHLRQIL